MYQSGKSDTSNAFAFSSLSRSVSAKEYLDWTKMLSAFSLLNAQHMPWRVKVIKHSLFVKELNLVSALDIINVINILQNIGITKILLCNRNFTILKNMFEYSN
jgi:hypothetical protein